MVFSSFHLEFYILYLVGLSLGIDNNDPWDIVFPDGDPWDIECAEEDSNITDVISLLGDGEVLITTHTPPDWSMIPITSEANEMQIAAPDQICHEPTGTAGTSHSLTAMPHLNKSTRVSAEDVRTPSNRVRGKFVSVGKRSRRLDATLREAFANLKPISPKLNNLSQRRLEWAFILQKDHYLWREMIDYPLNKWYLEYWGQVCDYFWYKSDPNDKRSRGCFVNILGDAGSRVQVRFRRFPERNAKAQLLRCICFYYLVHVTKPDSDETLFAVHKHADNEYFLLHNVPNSKLIFTIDNLVTEVFLPPPICKLNFGSNPRQ